MRQIWRILAILLLAAVVFGAAAYLDRNPLRPVTRDGDPIVAAKATTEAAAETNAETESTQTVPQPQETQETEAAETTVPMQTQLPEEHFWLTFVGDCTFGANPVNTYDGYGFIKTIGEDYQYPFRNVISWFENDEATFLNLEGPLTDTGNPMQKKHVFRGPTDYINILLENSVEAVNLANNHTMDYGQKGYDSTVATLEAAGVPFGQENQSSIFTTENGLSIGLYGAVYYSLDTEKITADISALRNQGCDLVIFAPHWGVEGSYRPTQDQVKLAHAAIDAGADIVWGGHPHVLQPIEEYNDGIIYYSLGNFSFGGNAYPKEYDTVLLQQEVIRAGDGTVTLGELIIVPACISSVSNRNNYQPTPYEQGTETYNRVLQKLDGTWTGPNLPIQ